MPAKEGLFNDSAIEPTKSDGSNKEIDRLVEKLTDTLKLKARHKQTMFRSSPYWNDDNNKHCSGAENKRNESHSHRSTSPYRNNRNKPKATTKSGSPESMLMELDNLLREGTLIQEAVKRLHKYKHQKHVPKNPASPGNDFVYDEMDV
ncbi:unnamed protein product [Owenia fusiformis]|uniref:Uncharacterized protein n=1 Tax=Owenia fusiformis TaxID=6347 RepID=A0A8J1TT63_OWEFU|nr:unnamed protein product [Owenia fusiformis]